MSRGARGVSEMRPICFARRFALTDKSEQFRPPLLDGLSDSSRRDEHFFSLFRPRSKPAHLNFFPLSDVKEVA
jgi:hypothetical protein